MKLKNKNSTIILIALSIASITSISRAADFNVSNTDTAAKLYDSSNQSVNVTGAGFLNVNTSANAAIRGPNGVTGLTGLNVNVNTTSDTQSITATGTNGALEISGTDQFGNITVTRGKITSNSANNGTVYLHGTSSSAQNLITLVGTGSSITNTATTGSASVINSNTTAGTDLFITLNSGSSISTNTSNTNASAIAINLADSYTGGGTITPKFTIINSGTISAGTNTGTTAINVNNNATNGEFNLTNNSGGLINGDIKIQSGNASILLSSSSTLRGNIVNTNSDSSSVLTITNNGNIYGNITTNGGHTLLNMSDKDAVLDGEVNFANSSTNTGSNIGFIGGTITGAITLRGAVGTGNDVVSISPTNFGDVVFAGGINGNGASPNGDGEVIFRGEDFDLTSSTNVNSNIGMINKVGAINIKQVTLDAKNSSIRVGVLTIENSSTFKTGTGTFSGGANLVGDNSGRAILDMTAAPMFMDGNITSNGFGTILFGQHAHTSSGTFTVAAGDIISTVITSPTAVGHMTSAGLVTNNANTKLNVAVDYTQNTYNSGKTYYILTSNVNSTSTIKQITDNNLTITSTGDPLSNNTIASNRVGVLNYHTAQSGNNLILYIEKDDKTLISKKVNEQNIYENIDQVGSNATNELKVMQNYIMTSNITTAAQRQDALTSLAPSDLGLHKTVIDNSLASITAAEKRLEEIRDRFRFGKRAENDRRFAASSYKILDQNGNELYASDDAENDNSLYAALNRKLAKSKKSNLQTQTDYNDKPAYNKAAVKNNLFTAWPRKSNGLWIQGIGTSSRQQDKTDFAGYKASSFGITVGYDRMIAVNAVLGASVSALKSNINSAGNLKEADINSYQFNLYAGEFCPTYFLDAVIGVAYNQYDSSRQMPVIAKTAKGDFTGNTYSGRARIGYIAKLSSNWDLIPEADLTYAKNNIGSYTEKGAGTANLNVKTNDATFVEGAIGASIGYLGYSKKTSALYPRLKVMYGYAFKGYEQFSNSNFVNQNVGFFTQSAAKSKSAVRADLGVNMFTLKSVIVSANYLYEYRPTGFRSHSGVLRASYQF